MAFKSDFSSDIRIDTKDIERINKRFQGLEPSMRKIWAKTAAKQVRTLVPQVRNRAPQETGLLKKSISAGKTRTGNARIFVNAKVFAANSGSGWSTVKLKGKARRTSWDWRRENLGKLKRPSKYAHLVEFGQHKKRNVPAKPFMLDIFYRNRSVIARQTEMDFEKEINRIHEK